MKSAKDPGQLLVVDDNKVNRLLLARGLESQGHVISTAENGRIAMEMLRAKPYDLILLDIDMPEMNGFEVLEAVLNDRELQNIPVIMTSASDELDRVVKCIELGAEDYLVKPLNPVLLRARVGASLEKKYLRDQQRKLLHTFATPEVAEKLLSEGFSLGGQHVNASILFADIRSFTTMAEKEDPGLIIELLNDYFALMFDAITTYGGTVNQMIGDGLMAVFGAPIYHEDHSRRAVRAALEMLENLDGFNAQQAALKKLQIHIGIGIASGQVVAGYTGTQHRATFTCIGDTVNLAARIEAHTKVVKKPILIDENTYTGLGESFTVDALGEELFKGKTLQVKIYSVQR
jgi:adenylate cyclase